MTWPRWELLFLVEESVFDTLLQGVLDTRISDSEWVGLGLGLGLGDCHPSLLGF